jgi:predicted nucleic acid-binding Zn finger protein
MLISTTSHLLLTDGLCKAVTHLTRVHQYGTGSVTAVKVATTTGRYMLVPVNTTTCKHTHTTAHTTALRQHLSVRRVN